MEKPTCPDPMGPGTGAWPAAGEPSAKKSNGGVDEGAAAGSGRFGPSCVGRWLPEEYREELCKVVRLTAPLVSRGGDRPKVMGLYWAGWTPAGTLISTIASRGDHRFAAIDDDDDDVVSRFFSLSQLLSRLLNFLLHFTTTIFCGRIGNAELAGYALASVVQRSTFCTILICMHAAPALLSCTFLG